MHVMNKEQAAFELTLLNAEYVQDRFVMFWFRFE